MPVEPAQKRRIGGATTLVTLPSGVDPTDDDIAASFVGDASSIDLLAVSYSSTPEEWTGSLFGSLDGRPGEYQFVSVDDRHRSTAVQSGSGGGPSPDPTAAPDIVTPVDDPADLASIGTAISEYLDVWNDTGREPVVLFDSVSAVLEQTDRETAMQFFQTLRYLLSAADGRGYFFFHPDGQDLETMSMLRTTFDDVVTYVGTGGAEKSIGEDDPLMEILSDAIRRRVMEVLAFEESVTVSTLAAHLHETGAGESASTLEVALYHTHVPKLVDTGLVEFDDATGTVTLAAPLERFRPYLRTARERFEE